MSQISLCSLLDIVPLGIPASIYRNGTPDGRVALSERAAVRLEGIETFACEQENGAISGTDRAHRRSSVSESLESQQRSPSNHVDMDASPAGPHPPPWLR